VILELCSSCLDLDLDFDLDFDLVLDLDRI
jgi:hypothetical protein